MIREIIEPNDAVTIEVIEDFARRHQMELPASYLAFLLRNNGGRPVPASFPITGFPDNPFGAIQAFFGLKASIPTEDLEGMLTDLSEVLPGGILPIACTGGGDYLCLDLRAPSTPVVFWDRRPSWGNNVWQEDDLYRVAPDFDELLQSPQDAPSIT